MTSLLEAFGQHAIECTGRGEVTCRCRESGWMSWTTYHRHVIEALGLDSEMPVAELRALLAQRHTPDPRPSSVDGPPYPRLVPGTGGRHVAWCSTPAPNPESSAPSADDEWWDLFRDGRRCPTCHRDVMGFRYKAPDKAPS